ncbi:DMT family transporter [Plantactinospora sp. WMMC1484]|uniref:DMT family transporter n=1 Tax=Plantactinospora sp. WMMC1484 TaxID=3404122 RepID=UPI003BF55D8A
MAYLLALVAAALFGVGASVQQRVAAEAPDESVLHLSLLWYLVRQPLWLVGVATALIGNLFAGSALGMGGVALVQPLLVARLIFALPLAARWNRRSLHRREWLGAVAVIAGLAAFMVAGRPSPGENGVDSDGSVPRWLLTGGTVAAITAGLVLIARRLRPNSEAPVLGAGAGMLFALQSGLTSMAVSRFGRDGLLALLTTWPTYAVVGTAVAGTLLAQSAYKLAPLPASYPPLAATEPLAGIAIGLSLLGGTLVVTPAAVAVQALGLAVMTVGVFVLASSSLVTGAHHTTGRPTPDDATVEAHQEERRSGS